MKKNKAKLKTNKKKQVKQKHSIKLDWLKNKKAKHKSNALTKREGERKSD